MENQKSSSSLKVIVAILAILLVGSLVYIFKMTSDADVVQTELKATLTEKESVMKDLEELKSTYDAAIAENTSMSDELIQERDKVVNLMSDLNTTGLFTNESFSPISSPTVVCSLSAMVFKVIIEGNDLAFSICERALELIPIFSANSLSCKLNCSLFFFILSPILFIKFKISNSKDIH